jgi:hypothetical protein
MYRSSFLLLLPALLISSLCQAQTNPFLGRWDFDFRPANGIGANWLGVYDKNGQLEVWFQPTGGHVYQIKDYKLSGSHLTFSPGKGESWELDASDGKLAGVAKHGSKTTPVHGVQAPALDRPEPAAWTKPEAIFDGKDLNGWEPIGEVAHNNWVVQDGLLVNEKHGANLKTKRTFTDYKLHFEVNCPDNANSGFYQRGRYELQLEYEAVGENPPERAMGAIYGRIAPTGNVPRSPGQWETFDVTLVGRTITVIHNGTKTIDHKVIEGITGGALDANEGEPGPFYIQGDHTGGLKFRNITVAVPQS